MMEWGDGDPEEGAGLERSPGLWQRTWGCLERTLGGIVKGLRGGHNIGCDSVDLIG